jgi:tripartite ATP-independent transporter DctM subunit
MSSEALGLYGIAVLLAAMLFLKVPPGYAMAIVGFIGIAIQTSFTSATNLLVTDLWAKFSDYGLTVIPMFILVGELIYYAGYSDSLYQTTYKWFGARRGGLAITSILACAGFSAICGSNTATAATMSAVAIPSMRKYKYHPTLMSGAVAVGSTLGVMIPPSIVLVVYGLYTSQSIGKLFFGVLVPGLLLTALFALTVSVICMRHPEWGPRGEPSTLLEKIKALPGILDILVLFVAIMVALFSGKITATEAAAVGCFIALVLCGARGKLSFEKFKGAMHHTLRISCMVFMIVAGATIFGRFMAVSRLPYECAAWIGSLALPGWVILLIMLGIYAAGGCLMDALAFLLISLPIFYPLAEKLGYDPVWFGVILCLVTTLGAITPPVGICCFVIAGMHKDIPMAQVFKGSMYYLPAYILTCALMMVFPYWTVLALANLVR